MKDAFDEAFLNNSQIDTKWRVGYSIPPVEDEDNKHDEIAEALSVHPGRNLGSLIEFNRFSEEQINAILTSAQKMDALLFHAGRITPVTEAYREFASLLVLVIERKVGLQQAPFEKNLNSYISQFDMYKNHWEKYIKTTLMKNNPSKSHLMEDVFVCETHASFDSKTGYALACCIRDFMTHSNSIIDHIGTSTDGLRITMQRDRLLNDFNWNQTKRGLIGSQNEELNLINIVAESYGELLRINESLLDAMLDGEIANCCEILMAAYKVITESGIKSNEPGFKSSEWILYRFTEVGTLNVPADFPGNQRGESVTTQSVGMDWIGLRWDWYDAIYEKCKTHGMVAE